MLHNLFTRAHNADYSEETIDILRLIRSENVGTKTFLHLIKFFGSATKALGNIQEFSVKGGLSKPIKVYTKSQAMQELELLSKNNAYIVTYKDFNYPQLLLQIHDFPPVLTYKGRVELFNSQKIVSMVGSRNASINYRKFASQISSELCDAGFTIVSGLARGIDTSVHQGSRESTIAVIAGGIDHVYPLENQKLYDYIAENALLVAELRIGCTPVGKHFPQRNRIISGVSLATVVIEAGLKSGSLITANFALDQNREVFACPGFPLDPRCIGSNKLIKNGAYMLESSKDIVDNIPSYKKTLQNNFEENEEQNNNFAIPLKAKSMNVTDQNRHAVKKLLSVTPVTYDILSIESGLPMPIIYTVCLELELAGKIARHFGNKVSLIY